MATLSLIGPLARVKSSGCLLTGLTVWRTYKSSSIRFGGELSEKNEVEGSHDKSTATLQPVQLSGHCSLIDLAKQTEGMEKSEQFTLALNEFLVREKYRKGHIGFIRTAMLRMDEFGLEKDLETYNKLIDIFPRGRFAPRSMIDAFWPRSTPQLELCLEVLTKMEENGVRPSIHTYKIIKAIFGRSLPLEKCIRIMYLFDIYGDMDPYEVRGELPTDPIELSRLALFRMSGENTQLMEIQVPEAGGAEGFIVGGNSDKQLKLLERLEGGGLSPNRFLHVQGPHRLWLKRVPQFYFTLRISGDTEVPSQSDGQQQPNSEGMVLGLCMCWPFHRESLQRWIRVLQEKYPKLSTATIIYDTTELEVAQNGQESDVNSRDNKQAKLATSY